MYVDVILDNSVESGGTISTNAGAVDIGSRASGLYFLGTIDEVRIWNDVRTQDEIVNYMNRTIENPADEANLVAYYKFDETAGGTDINRFELFLANTTNVTEQSSEFGITLFPNPVVDVLNILSNSDITMNIQILDMTGKTLYNFVSNQSKTGLNISSLKTGLYLVKIKSSKGEIITKIIKE